MTRSPVLFRVDGTPRLGWERMHRCMVLASALQRRRRPTYFLGLLEPTTLAFGIKRVGNDWLEADGPAGSTDDLAELIQEVRRLQPAAVVVDGPDVSEDYLAGVSALGTLVVSMDHLATTRFASQLVINPVLAPGCEDYEFYPGTQLLLGSRYALVRPEVRRLRPTRAQEPPQPFRALVALGDDDPHGQTLELAKVLANVPRIGRVDMIVRPQHPGLGELRAFAAAHADRIDVATEPAEISARLTRCHFAITDGSGWALELACIGIPQLLMVQSESHWPTAQRLEEEGAATCLGWYENVSAQTIRQAVQTLLTDPLERQAMARCGRQLIDGRGPDRLVTALEVMLHPSRRVQLSEAA